MDNGTMSKRPVVIVYSILQRLYR